MVLSLSLRRTYLIFEAFLCARFGGGCNVFFVVGYGAIAILSPHHCVDEGTCVLLQQLVARDFFPLRSIRRGEL